MSRKKSLRRRARRSRPATPSTEGCSPRAVVEHRPVSVTLAPPNEIELAWHGLRVRAAGSATYLVLVVLAVLLLMMVGEHAGGATRLMMAIKAGLNA
jgi:hypothetical protein